jgi:LmbE family N-acetylglucosaminyl deacetylase
MDTRLSALLLTFVLPLAAQTPSTILAIGAHAGDMEVSAGATLARASRQGAKVVILHLSLGENGNPRKAAADYGKQKHDEAVAAAKALNAEARFAPWSDGSVRDTKEAEEFVAQVIREVKPTQIITHWKNSIHPDHSATYFIANHATLLASVTGWRGAKSVWFAENWEDPEDFHPYIYVDTTEDMDTWRKATQCYEFLRGGISSFPYLQYYEGLSAMRGAESRKRHAEAFDVDPINKRRVLDTWPR